MKSSFKKIIYKLLTRFIFAHQVLQQVFFNRVFETPYFLNMNIITIVSVIIGVQFASVYAMDGDATYYELGMTACGEVYTDNDMVAAIAFGYWTTANPNVDPMCQKTATVTDPATGNSIQVMIKDKCQGCAMGDIDLSPAAFQQFRPESVGRFPIHWDFN